MQRSRAEGSHDAKASALREHLRGALLVLLHHAHKRQLLLDGEADG